MRKTDQLEMERKIKEAIHVKDPRQDFVQSLLKKIKGQGTPFGGSFRLHSLSRRFAWLILVNVILLLSAVLIAVGPRNVKAFIADLFNILDPGVQTVEAAGLVTNLGETPQPIILSPDSSLEDITVTLDWVHIDENRLVMEFVAKSIPSGMVLDMPKITADQTLKQDLTFSSTSMEEDTGQIIFTAYDPIKLDYDAKQVNFSVDLYLIESRDPDKTPLAIFHYDLEDIPVYEGQTQEIEQSVPAMIGDLELQLESFNTTSSLTEVTFCVNLSAEEILALPKSDIKLQIGSEPFTYDYVVLGLNEKEYMTCTRLGFFEGGAPESGMTIFQFKYVYIAILQDNTFEQDESIEKIIPKP